MVRPKFPAAKYIKDVLRSQSPESSVPQSPNYKFTRDEEKEVVTAVINQLRAQGIDITADYDNWIRLAAAFSSTFGEDGRVYFHCVSQNYSGYNVEECDELYSRIMKTNKNVVSLGTFYHLCTEHGVDVKAIYKDFGAKKAAQSPQVSEISQVSSSHYTQIDDVDEDGFAEALEPFTKKIEKKLPEFLRSIIAKATSEDEKDMMLLVALTIIASALNKKVKGMYNDSWEYPTLYLLVVGKAASRKGIIAAMRNLVKPIQEYQHDIYKEQKQEYMAKKAQEKDSKATDLEEPKKRMHCIPANSSAAAFFQALCTMQGCGLVIDTEIDTMLQVFKQDWGNFSECLRKMFHHELIEIYRKTNDEYYEVDEPAASVLLSGTFKQFVNLIQNVENGLFSRFLLFMKKSELKWRPIKNNEDEVDNRTYFLNLGTRLFRFYKELQELENPVIFELSKSQWTKFNTKFNTLYDTFVTAEGEDIHASVVRFGLITFRIMMILTMLRVMTSGKEIPSKVCCSDLDFKLGMYISESIMPHMAKFYELLEPVKKDEKKTNLVFNREDMTKLYQVLPKRFTTAEYIEIAAKQNIPESTAKRWLKKFATELIIIKEKKGEYRKNKKISS